jgi:hypothetical protein
LFDDLSEAHDGGCKACDDQDEVKDATHGVEPADEGKSASVRLLGAKSVSVRLFMTIIEHR